MRLVGPVTQPPVSLDKTSRPARRVAGGLSWRRRATALATSVAMSEVCGLRAIRAPVREVNPARARKGLDLEPLRVKQR